MLASARRIRAATVEVNAPWSIIAKISRGAPFAVDRCLCLVVNCRRFLRSASKKPHGAILPPDRVEMIKRLSSLEPDPRNAHQTALALKMKLTRVQHRSLRGGISAPEPDPAGRWIRHARSRSACPPMFEARDFPSGLDRVGMVCLAIIAMMSRDQPRARFA